MVSHYLSNYARANKKEFYFISRMTFDHKKCRLCVFFVPLLKPLFISVHCKESYRLHLINTICNRYV